MATYYPVYQNYYRGLNEANEVLRLENQALGLSYNRMIISNAPFTSNIPGMLAYAQTFFASYAADTDPAKNLISFLFIVMANLIVHWNYCRHAVKLTVLCNRMAYLLFLYCFRNMEPMGAQLYPADLP